MAPILEVKNLSHTYGKGTPFEHTALQDISFAVDSGEFIGIIGHTGSGKSTLMQHLNGLLKPSSGSVLLGGKDLWSDKKFTRQSRFRVGLVFQYPEYQLFEETVYKDIAFGPKNMGLGGAELEQRVRDAMEDVGLDESYLDKSPFELSGGEKRRVAIAGVIVTKPEILILTSPLSGLIPKDAQKMRELIKYFGDTYTIFLCTPSVHDLCEMCDEIIVLQDGRLKMIAPSYDEALAREILANPEKTAPTPEVDAPKTARASAIWKMLTQKNDDYEVLDADEKEGED